MLSVCYQIFTSLVDKRMQKAETAEVTDEKGWAGWIRILLEKDR